MKKMNRSMVGLLGVLFLLNLFFVSYVMPCYAEEKLSPSDPALYGSVGSSVSMNGDTAVVGGPSLYGYSTGEAYVFRHDGAGWVEVARLTADVPVLGDLFGASVAITGETIVVGAPYSGNKGAATSSNIMAPSGQTAKLTADPAYANANFGVAVSMSGDTIVIGAPYSGSSGAAYVFKYDGTEWVQVNRLTADDAVSYENFGDSVSIIEQVRRAPGDDDMRAQPTSSHMMVPSGTGRSLRRRRCRFMRSLRPVSSVRTRCRRSIFDDAMQFSLCFQV
jgi:hypothetical protein